MGHTATAYESGRPTFEQLLTVRETAECLAVTPRTIYRLVDLRLRRWCRFVVVGHVCSPSVPRFG